MKWFRVVLEGSVVFGLLAILPHGRANPAGESVGAGNATFDRSVPGRLTIHQGSDKVIINWKDFSIGLGETTKFLQPSATSIALNRVTTGNPSKLYGNLEANGTVYLLNPNGILVGPKGAINTRTFLGSTLDISDASFLSNAKLTLSGSSQAAVINQGTIHALGGDIFLVARTVENSGQLQAAAGTVGLAAGSEVVIVPAGKERLTVIAGTGSGSASGQGVSNQGKIEAVAAELKAAGGNIYALAINNGGIVRATGVRREQGRVFLTADGGDIENSGSISAGNADGSGGSITISAGHADDNQATAISRGTIAARGESAGTRGGSVKIEGDYVGLLGEALIDVSGEAGGGTARVGGGFHGADPETQNALRTYVGPEAVIRADGLSKGDGGEIAVWSDEVTRFFGMISARGGERRGQGGNAEVSGKQSLAFAGLADLSAPRGQQGTLLLDPNNLNITDAASGGSADASLPFVAPTAADETVSRGALEAIAGTADITLQANDNLTVSDLAGDVLNLTTASGHTVKFEADADNDGVGAFSMDASDTIRTRGGAVTISGAALSLGKIDTTGAGTVTAGGAVRLSGQDIVFGATTTIDAGAADVTLDPRVAGRSIDIGAAGAGLNLTEADFGKITTTGTLNIGNDTSGQINVGNDVDFGSKNVKLATAQKVAFGSGDTLTTSGNMTINAGTGLDGDNSGTAHVVANQITLAATAGKIGTDAANPFAVNATSLNASTAGAAGDDIFVLDTAGGLAVGNVNAGSGNVVLNVLNGSLSSQSADLAPDIIGNTVTLTVTGAGSDIGISATSPLELNATTLNASTAGAAGDDLFVGDTAGGLAVGTINVGAGNATLFALSGSLTSATVDGTADIVANKVTLGVTGAGSHIGASSANPLEVDAVILTAITAANGQGDISILDTAGGVALGETVPGATTTSGINAFDGDVTLRAQGGAITSLAIDGTPDIVGAAVTLSTTGSGGIGVDSSTPLEIDATSVTATTPAGAYNISLLDTAGGLTVNSLSAGAMVQVRSRGLLTLGASTITAGSGNDVVFSAEGPGSSANINNLGVTINTSGGGRWFLYSTSPERNAPALRSVGGVVTFGSLLVTAQEFEKTLARNPPSSFANDGQNRLIFAAPESSAPFHELAKFFSDALPVDDYWAVPISFGPHDTTPFAAPGDLWLTSLDLYEEQYRAGTAPTVGASADNFNRRKFFIPTGQ